MMNQWQRFDEPMAAVPGTGYPKYTKMTENMHSGCLGYGFYFRTGIVVPGTGCTENTTLNIWAPSRAMALESRRRSRSLLALPKEELRSAGGAKKRARSRGTAISMLHLNADTILNNNRLCQVGCF
jgi:hypothetical protein